MKTYVGYTSDLVLRMREHNLGERYKNAFTKKFRPWELIYFEEFETKQEAMQREKWYKSGVGREFIQNNKKIWVEHSPPRRA